VNNVRVNLAKANLKHIARVQRHKEILTILEDMPVAVPFGEAEVQDLFGGFMAIAVGFQFASAAGSRAKSMHDPIELREWRSFQDL
jgi:hypothetical protein